MATRYSGDLKITIVYDDRGFYRSSVSRGGRKLWRGNVRPPPIGFGSGVAYDSEKAYDKMAEAALSFADNDKPGLGDAAEYGQDGFKIRRVKGYWEKWPGGHIRPRRLSRDSKHPKYRFYIRSSKRGHYFSAVLLDQRGRSINVINGGPDDSESRVRLAAKRHWPTAIEIKD